VINFLLQCLSVNDTLLMVVSFYVFIKVVGIDFMFCIKLPLYGNDLCYFKQCKFYSRSYVWITVVVCCFRYIAICHPFHEPRYCTLTRAKVSILLVIFFTLAGNIPRWFLFRKVPLNVCTSGCTIETCNKEHICIYKNFGLMDVDHGVYFTFEYFIPLIMMSIMCVRIIYTVYTMRKVPGSRNNELRITMMLLVIICMLLLSRTMWVISVFKHIYSESYTEIWRLLYYLSSSTNFFIYFVFNSKFRSILLNRFKDTLD
jgi:hypothetical protein